MAEEIVKTENTDAEQKSRLPVLNKRAPKSSPFARTLGLSPDEYVKTPTLAEQAKSDPQSENPDTLIGQEAQRRDTENKPEQEPVATRREREAPAPKATPPKREPLIKRDGAEDLMYVQTTIPVDLAMEFKRLCRREKSTVRDELAKLISDAVARGSL